MIKFLKNIFSKKKSILADELIGIWENDLDDGSGWHGLNGYLYKFNNDNTILYQQWHQNENLFEQKYYWKRVTMNQFLISYNYSENNNEEIITYEISKVDGPYKSKLLKLIDINQMANNVFKEGIFGGGALFQSYK